MVEHVPLIALFALKIAFSGNLQHAKYQNFLPIRVNHGGPSGATKTGDF